MDFENVKKAIKALQEKSFWSQTMRTGKMREISSVPQKVQQRRM